MNYILWLDDLRNPLGHFENLRHVYFKNDAVIWCSSVAQAKTCVVLNGFPSIMFLDHDLGENEDTMMFLKWFRETYPESKPPEYYYLTANIVGRVNMESFLSSWKKSVQV